MNLFKSNTVLFALFFLSTICSLAQRYTSGRTHSSYIKHLSTDPGQRVTLIDQGLQMPIGSGTIPEGWQLIQDIATNPNTGKYDRYRQEIRGAQGEMILSLAPAMYSSTIGQDFQPMFSSTMRQGFQQSLQQTVMQALQSEITNLTLGAVQRSETLENNRQFQEMARIMQIEGLEASISGTRNGETISGIVHVILMKFPQNPNAGTYTSSVVLSPAHLLAQTLQTAERIRNSFQPNPKWQERVEQILQQSMKPMRTSEPGRSYYDYDTTYNVQDTTYYYSDTDTWYNPNDDDSLYDDWHRLVPNYDNIDNHRMIEENGWDEYHKRYLHISPNY